MNDTWLDTNFTSTTVKPFIDRIFSNTSLGHRLLERFAYEGVDRDDNQLTRWSCTLIRPLPILSFLHNVQFQVSAWWLVFIVVEFFILQVSGHHERFALNDSITSISAGMLSQCFKFGGRTVAIFLYVFIWNNFRLLELPWDSPWTWILCLFFQDLMYYFGHRAVHEAGFFWGLHTIHHSSEYYNFSTALRQAAFQDAGLAIYDVLQAFFIPPPIFLVHRYFSEILQFVMHTSLVDDLGPLGLVFNTPSHHRVHHGRNPYCIDKNYGGVFIIWDKMFGTFEAERKDDPPIYGLVHNENTFDQIYLQIKAALYPPGWFPGVPVIPFFHWMSLEDTAYGVPEPEKPVVKYNPPLEFWIKLYLIGHFVLLLAIFLHFEYDRSSLDYIDFSLKIAFFLVTMQTFGAFFDKRWYAPSLEISRCAGVLTFFGFTILDHIGAGPHRVFLMTIFGVSALLWIGYCIQEVRFLC
ncbi:unnamed protein product [Nippostrongylus brasiliensis]|uniref:Alkylglycerol monooxygenase n=1 Tax=Nippostrongylus brasiliensis TaxID=27835 RepID=A0A0N4Y4X0_NIPBR|nr:unnamed protein product [Nippostrongylus brasiliensis]